MAFIFYFFSIGVYLLSYYFTGNWALGFGKSLHYNEKDEIFLKIHGKINELSSSQNDIRENYIKSIEKIDWNKNDDFKSSIAKYKELILINFAWNLLNDENLKALYKENEDACSNRVSVENIDQRANEIIEQAKILKKISKFEKYKQELYIQKYKHELYILQIEIEKHDVEEKRTLETEKLKREEEDREQRRLEEEIETEKLKDDERHGLLIENLKRLNVGEKDSERQGQEIEKSIQEENTNEETNTIKQEKIQRQILKENQEKIENLKREIQEEKEIEIQKLKKWKDQDKKKKELEKIKQEEIERQRLKEYEKRKLDDGKEQQLLKEYVERIENEKSQREKQENLKKKLEDSKRIHQNIMEKKEDRILQSFVNLIQKYFINMLHFGR